MLFYAGREVMRNAACHGRGEDSSRPLNLQIEIAWRDGLEICIEDDGVGLASGEEGTDGGSGQGLALRSTMMAIVGGTLSVESVPNAYTRVRLTLPKW